MCNSYRNIRNKYTGKYVLSPCGKCKACLQEKAYKRTRRIDLQTKYDISSRQATLFVTLTYDNNCIPYINESEWYLYLNGEIDSLPVYRDYTKYITREKDCNYKRVYNKKLKVNTKVLELISDKYLDDDFLNKTSDFQLDKIRYTYNRNGKKYFRFDPVKVGILYYRDIQNFIKRYRINLKRKGYDFKTQFFVVGEYGPTTKRPHFHLLLSFPSSFVEVAKDTIVKAWTFDNITKYSEQIQLVTQNPASYVSSYVNSSNSLCQVLQNFKPFKQLHHYSQNYGMASSFTSLPKILESANKRRFEYRRLSRINGIDTVVSCVIPSYAIGRYFPKFKGFTRLSPHGLFNVLQNPQLLRLYKSLDYSEDDIHKISVCVRNKYLLFCELLSLKPNKANLLYFASVYSSIWTKYYSFLNIFAYENIKSREDYIYHFQNWFSMRFHHSLVTDILKECDINTFEPNYNNFPSVVNKHNKLLNAYNDYDKVKKIKNYALSEYSNL